MISTLHGNNLPELNNVSSGNSSNIFYLRGDSNMSNNSTTLNTTINNLNGGNNKFQLNNVVNHNHTIDFNQTMTCNWTVDVDLDTSAVSHNLKTVGNNTQSNGEWDDRYTNTAKRSAVSHTHNTTYNSSPSTVEFNIGSTFTRPTNISSTIGIQSYNVASQSDYNPYAFNYFCNLHRLLIQVNTIFQFSIFSFTTSISDLIVSHSQLNKELIRYNQLILSQFFHS